MTGRLARVNGALALAAIALYAVSYGSARAGAPRPSDAQALFDSQHALGLALKAMDSVPQPPAQELPPAIVRRIAASGLFDAKVRVYLLKIAGAEERFSAVARPRQVDAIVRVSHADRRYEDIVGASGDLTLTLFNSYGAALTSSRLWITSESSLTTFFEDYDRVLRAAVRAYEQFIRHAKLHPYPTQAALVAAAERQLGPWDRKLQALTQRGQDLRARNERIVRGLNTAEHRLRVLIRGNGGEGRFARRLAARDRDGEFARLLRT